MAKSPKTPKKAGAGKNSTPRRSAFGIADGTMALKGSHRCTKCRKLDIDCIVEFKDGRSTKACLKCRDSHSSGCEGKRKDSEGPLPGMSLPAGYTMMAPVGLSNNNAEAGPSSAPAPAALAPAPAPMVDDEVDKLESEVEMGFVQEAEPKIEVAVKEEEEDELVVEIAAPRARIPRLTGRAFWLTFDHEEEYADQVEEEEMERERERLKRIRVKIQRQERAELPGASTDAKAGPSVPRLCPQGEGLGLLWGEEQLQQLAREEEERERRVYEMRYKYIMFFV